jgi:hypothetical protein
VVRHSVKAPPQPSMAPKRGESIEPSEVREEFMMELGDQPASSNQPHNGPIFLPHGCCSRRQETLSLWERRPGPCPGPGPPTPERDFTSRPRRAAGDRAT